MKKGIVLLLLVAVMLGTRGAASGAGLSTDARSGQLIEQKVTKWKNPLKTFVGGERIYSVVLVQTFYKARNYQPAWSRDGRLIQADSLIRAVEEAYGDGLTPAYYHLGLIKSLVRRAENHSPASEYMVNLDILLTDTFLTLGCHLSGGCVDPVTIQSEWFAKRGNVDVASVLEKAVRKRQIGEALTRLRPAQGSYMRLREALGRYRALSSKGVWPRVAAGPLLKKDATSYRVAELRARLAASGDLNADQTERKDFFDEALERAVIFFQKRHGLEDDGVVGPATLSALNVPLKQRIRQMELNLERLRWILGNQEQRSIDVNIANFRLNVIENGKSVLSMKVVVGKPYLSTPVFTAKLTYLVINPSWNVPDSIARKEILKKIRKDPRYLAKENMEVLKGWGPREEEINPETIDWSRIRPGTLPYRFRQRPGPLNALGRIKFMLPNKYNVYLHDTPARSLFSQNVRTFSHGCTRIEKPVELAEYLLRDAGWTQEKILDAIAKGEEQKIRIPHPLNVNFLYLTAWVDQEGVLQFRNDIYGRDKRLDEALRRKPAVH